MALTFVRKIPTGLLPSGAIGTTNAVSFAALPAVGDLIVVVATANQASVPILNTPTDNQGHTYTLAVEKINSNSNARVYIWYTSVVTSGGTFTVTVTAPSSNSYQIGALDYTGAASWALGPTNTNTATGTAVDAGSVSPSGAAVYVGVMTGNNTALGTLTSDFTERWNQPSAGTAAMGTEDTITSGSVTLTWSITTSQLWIAAVAAFGEAGGAVTLMGQAML